MKKPKEYINGCVKCEPCNGSGLMAGFIDCPNCKGLGYRNNRKKRIKK